MSWQTLIGVIVFAAGTCFMLMGRERARNRASPTTKKDHRIAIISAIFWAVMSAGLLGSGVLIILLSL